MNKNYTEEFHEWTKKMLRTVEDRYLNPPDYEDEEIYIECPQCEEMEDRELFEKGLCPKCAKEASEKWKNFTRSLTDAEKEYLEGADL